MLGDELDIYDDLDDFQKVEEQKSKELQAWEQKYEDAKVEIAGLQSLNKALNKKVKTMEVNLQNLLETARAEIKRKETIITELRKEKDDICFRRKRAKFGEPGSLQTGNTERLLKKPEDTIRKEISEDADELPQPKAESVGQRPPNKKTKDVSDYQEKLTGHKLSRHKSDAEPKKHPSVDRASYDKDPRQKKDNEKRTTEKQHSHNREQDQLGEDNRRDAVKREKYTKSPAQQSKDRAGENKSKTQQSDVEPKRHHLNDIYSRGHGQNHSQWHESSSRSSRDERHNSRDRQRSRDRLRSREHDSKSKTRFNRRSRSRSRSRSTKSSGHDRHAKRYRSKSPELTREPLKPHAKDSDKLQSLFGQTPPPTSLIPTNISSETIAAVLDKLEKDVTPFTPIEQYTPQHLGNIVDVKSNEKNPTQADVDGYFVKNTLQQDSSITVNPTEPLAASSVAQLLENIDIALVAKKASIINSSFWSTKTKTEKIPGLDLMGTAQEEKPTLFVDNMKDHMTEEMKETGQMVVESAKIMPNKETSDAPEKNNNSGGGEVVLRNVDISKTFEGTDEKPLPAEMVVQRAEITEELTTQKNQSQEIDAKDQEDRNDLSKATNINKSTHLEGEENISREPKPKQTQRSVEITGESNFLKGLKAEEGAEKDFKSDDIDELQINGPEKIADDTEQILTSPHSNSESVKDRNVIVQEDVIPASGDCLSAIEMELDNEHLASPTRPIEGIQIIEDIRLPNNMDIEHIAVQMDSFDSKLLHDNALEAKKVGVGDKQIENLPNIDSKSNILKSSENCEHNEGDLEKDSFVEKIPEKYFEEQHEPISALIQDKKNDVLNKETTSKVAESKPAPIMYAQPDSTRADQHDDRDDDATLEAAMIELITDSDKITMVTPRKSDFNLGEEADIIELTMQKLHQQTSQVDEAAVTSTSMKLQQTPKKDLLEILSESPVAASKTTGRKKERNAERVAEIERNSPMKMKIKIKKPGAPIASEAESIKESGQIISPETSDTTPLKKRKLNLTDDSGEEHYVPQTPGTPVADNSASDSLNVTIDETINTSSLNPENNTSISDYGRSEKTLITKRCSLGNSDYQFERINDEVILRVTRRGRRRCIAPTAESVDQKN